MSSGDNSVAAENNRYHSSRLRMTDGFLQELDLDSIVIAHTKAAYLAASAEIIEGVRDFLRFHQDRRWRAGGEYPAGLCLAAASFLIGCASRFANYAQP